MGPEKPSTETELLISRLVDGEAAEQDWASFRALAERDGTLWRDLAEYQRDHAELSAAVQAAIAAADGVEAQVGHEINRRFAERMRIVSSWGGWAAAAAIVLVWLTGLPHPGAGQGAMGGGQAAGIGPTAAPMTAADAFQTYLDRGQESGLVVAEVPTRVLIEAKPTKSGGYEVVYLRQIMERKQVRELNTWGTDDLGRPVPVRFQVAPAKAAGAF